MVDAPASDPVCASPPSCACLSVIVVPTEQVALSLSALKTVMAFPGKAQILRDFRRLIQHRQMCRQPGERQRGGLAWPELAFPSGEKCGHCPGSGAEATAERRRALIGAGKDPIPSAKESTGMDTGRSNGTNPTFKTGIFPSCISSARWNGYRHSRVQR